MPILGLILLKLKHADLFIFAIYARAAGLLAPRTLLQPGDILCSVLPQEQILINNLENNRAARMVKKTEPEPWRGRGSFFSYNFFVSIFVILLTCYFQKIGMSVIYGGSKLKKKKTVRNLLKLLWDISVFSISDTVFDFLKSKLVFANIGVCLRGNRSLFFEILRISGGN